MIANRGLVLVSILLGNIVFWHFTGMHFALVSVVSILNPRHRAGFKEVSFFHQFIDAFRVRLLDPGHTL